MSELKKQLAITLLMIVQECPEWIAMHTMKRDGLPKVEKLLNEAGYHFEPEAKQWTR